MGVVIPLANEENTVDELLDRVFNQLQSNDRVYTVLDNACRDGTGGRVKRYIEKDPRLRLVWAPENRCVVDAYFRGYRAALSDKCTWILEMDGGLSHLPEEIPLFIDAMEQGYDFAAGSRFAEGGSLTGSFRRKLVSWGGTALTNAVLGTTMKDMTSGFECFTFDALHSVVENGVHSRFHFFQTEIRYSLRDSHWIEIPITYSDASSSVGFAAVTEAFRNLWRLRQQSPVTLKG